MSSANKRYVVIGLLVVMLVVTGYLNYTYNNSQSQHANADVETGASPAPSQEQQADASAVAEGNPKEEDGSAIQQTVAAAGYFANFRTQREQTRNKELELLESVIGNKASDAESVKSAQEDKITLAQRMDQEVTVEGLVKAKGFSDAVVTIRSGSVNVVVGSKEITNAQSAQILEIVQRETGEKAQNIKIMPYN